MLPLMVFLLIGCNFYLGIIWKFHQHMEHLQITLQSNLYLDPNPLIRGHTYSMKIDTNFADDSTGYLYVWRDGVQIVNYHGPIGFGDEMYWKEGIYRDVDAGNQTMAVDYSNLKIVTPTETDVLTVDDLYDQRCNRYRHRSTVTDPADPARYRHDAGRHRH